MFRRKAVLVACVVVSVGYVVSGQGPERPNFSGTWYLFTPELEAAEKQLARTETLISRGLATQQQVDAAAATVQGLRIPDDYITVDQSASTLSVTKSQSKQVFALYNLDGSDSRYTVNNVPISAKASWAAAGQLVATETATPKAGMTTRGKRSWSISADGLLTMQWTELTPQGAEIRTSTAVYRRAK
jgi:hypothetical protein